MVPPKGEDSAFEMSPVSDGLLCIVCNCPDTSVSNYLTLDERHILSEQSSRTGWKYASQSILLRPKSKQANTIDGDVVGELGIVAAR